MNNLEEVAKNIRRKIVDMIYRAQSSHVGCSLSSADIWTALYFGGVMNISPDTFEDENRDRLVLSKGHGVSAFYATLSERGFFGDEILKEYGKDGTTLASHIVKDVLPGAETSNGSGGHGLSLGVGMAKAAKIRDLSYRTFVLSGDGEMEEGSVWEAMLFAGQHKLDNLVLIVDRNHLQDGKDGQRTEDILDIEDLEKKAEAFKWDSVRVDGHSFDELIPALKETSDKPRMIIAETIKGKGVSYMEDRGEWHGKAPDEDEYKIAMEELT